MRLNPQYETLKINGHCLLVNTHTDTYYEVDDETDGLLRHPETAENADPERVAYLKEKNILLMDNEQPAKIRSRSRQTLSHFRLFSVPVNQFLDRHQGLNRRIMSPTLPRNITILSIVGIALTVLSVISLFIYGGELFGNFTMSEAVEFLPAVYLLGTLITCFHELGHVMLCRHYCGYVGRCGLMMFFLIPAFYTNTTVSKFAERPQRRQIILAGIRVQLILAGILSVLIILSAAMGWQVAILFLMLNILNYVYILLNLNPLFKYDGYWLLSQRWDMDNLYERSIAEVLCAVRRNERVTSPKLFAYGLCVIAFYLIMWGIVTGSMLRWLYPLIRNYTFIPIGVMVFLILREMYSWRKIGRQTLPLQER